MITVIRTVHSAQGKYHEALAWARQTAKLLNEAHGTDVKVIVPIGGAYGVIGWLASADSLAHLEELVTGISIMGANSEPHQLHGSKAEGLFVGSTGHDQIWRSV